MIEVYTARRVITMNPSWPEGEAIAVRDGRILEVGSLASMRPWLEQDDSTIIDRFAEQVIMPGLIDPHLHPLMAAVLLPMQFITALEWRFPWETVPATETPAAYRKALTRHAAAGGDAPFFTWGYHRHWHDEMSRALLDEIFGARPAVAWQRSFHELYMNSAMMAELGMDERKLEGRHQIDVARGHFYENGLGYAINKLNPIIMSQEWIDRGLTRLRQLVHFGGHTTVGDMAVGIFNADLEHDAAERMLDLPDTPFRVLRVPHAVRLAGAQRSHEETLSLIEALPERNTHRFRYSRKVKLFTDGAFFSQLAVLQAPGYIDGHLGEWLMTPPDYEAAARVYWNAGYEIHVHCTGDLGLQLAIDTLETLQWERPRFNHGYTIEHFGFSTPEQVRRIKALGANVSANVYYLHELSAAYGDQGVGVERSQQMARLGTCERDGVLWTLHSDFPMAPAMPLYSAWVACTRQNCEGDVVGPAECVTLDAALRAITIDAATVLGLQEETGSLRAGKCADFVVLDQDPYAVGAAGLKDLNILATCFEGQITEVSQP
ncbi:MAG: amidohydrolase family protein [Pseudomonadota bacterium]